MGRVKTVIGQYGPAPRVYDIVFTITGRAAPARARIRALFFSSLK